MGSFFVGRIFKILFSEKALIAVLLALSIGTRFFLFGYPNQIVFDEFYFANFTSRYFDGAYYFDIHPPLAKLMMAGAAKILGRSPDVSFSFSSIGQKYSNDAYKIFRGVVGIFGVLLILGIYGLARELFKSKWIAFFAGLFAVFDSALTAQSRFILTDVILLAFGVGGLWLLMVSRRSAGWKKWALFGLASLAVAGSFSVKWTGLVFFGIFGAILVFDLIKGRKMKDFLVKLPLFLFIAAVFYLFVLSVHLFLLPKTGTGDLYMSPGFRATLEGDVYQKEKTAEELPWYKKIIELNGKMFSYNRSVSQPHPDQSTWKNWIFGEKSIYFWVDGQGYNSPDKPQIYLRANKFLWQTGLAAVLGSAIWFIFQIFRKKKDEDLWPVGLALLGYGANLIPYLFISRPAFLYHYFPSLIFLIILLSWSLNRLFRRYPFAQFAIALLVIYYWIGSAAAIYGL